VDIDWRIVIACVGAGMGAELIRRYRGFKAQRRMMAAPVRNAGFWTDQRLYLSELIFCVLFVAAPFSAIILLTSIERPIWVPYIGLLTYSLMVFLLMKSLNTREPQ
jgi:hypothetical protein